MWRIPATAQVGATHDCGIQLDAAIAAQHRATASVEERIVFEHSDRGLHRIQRTATALQQLLPGLKRLRQRSPIFLFTLPAKLRARQRTRAAVNGYCVHFASLIELR